MSFRRDLGWDQIDAGYRSSIAFAYARYALGLKYDMLPEDVLHQAKRCLVDGFASAIGAYAAPGRPMCENLVQQLGGVEEASVFGSGIRTSAANATLVNSFLVRYLDGNDLGGGGHNSDCIPAILAMGEREKINGKDFLISIVISYELGSRVNLGVTAVTNPEKVWYPDMRAGLSMPPALGPMMGLNAEQIANAIGAVTCHEHPLAILDGDREEYRMSKNLRFGWVSYNAILCCMLAKQGFTGPINIMENKGGFGQAMLKGSFDIEKMLDFNGWHILDTRHKYFCANYTTLGGMFATWHIVKENDLKPEDIASVRIKTGAREARHTTAFPKKYPRNGESADHSGYFSNAMIIKERTFGPDSFKPEKFTDPVVIDLIERMTVEADASIPEWSLAGISEITTKDGRKFMKRIENPHGFGDDPLTDKELEEKFTGMASKYMSSKQMRQVLNTVWNVEKLKDIGELADLLVFKK